MAQQFIPKPVNRESIAMFGDGDEAVFGHIGNSTQEGYYVVHLRPTKKMRWLRQIPDNAYDSNDMWIKKIYKKDLCLQLSFDPDFPVWLILCDYHGNEDTPLMRMYKELIYKNRDLDRKLRNLKITLNMIRIEERRRVEHPEQWVEEQFAFATKAKKAIGEPVVIQQQQPQEYPEET